MSIKNLSTIIPISTISSSNDYLTNMSMNIYDKIDFILEIKSKFDVLIDIGCADGELICQLKSVSPHLICIGYDIDKNLIKSAKERIRYDNVYFTSSPKKLKRICNELKMKNKHYKFMVNMSSLLHEIYTYCDIQQQEDFKKMIYDLNSDYISIRDFHIDEFVQNSKPDPKIVKWIKPYFESLNSPSKKISKYGSNILECWENVNGKIKDSYKSMMHLLLKLKPLQQSDEILEREFFENYLSVGYEKIKELISFKNQKYHTIYKLQYSTSNFKNLIRKYTKLDVDAIDSLPSTKIKIIFEKASS